MGILIKVIHCNKMNILSENNYCTSRVIYPSCTLFNNYNLKNKI